MRRTPSQVSAPGQATGQVAAKPRRRRPFRHLFRTVRDRRAVAALEFAVVVGPFLALMLASLQIPLIYFADEALQGAAIQAGREIMTGQAQQSGMTQAAFKQAVCGLLGAMFSCSNIMVDIESASNFSSINTGSPTVTYGRNGQPNNNWAYSPGGPDDVVIVRVMYNWPVMASALIPGLANQPGGQRLLIGTAVFKNEPYP